jgi:stage V sporulation protein R
MGKLTPELEQFRQKIEKVARGYGLDFFDTIFEMVSYEQINQIAAYGGFPVRYPHWKFGMEYEQLSKSYEYGLSKIYEMVINNNPCYAYLMEGNTNMDQKLVMAHVYGHCDFFKNNIWFAPTNRKMMDQMGNHASRIRRYIDKYGQDTVESFIDICLSLENLIDRYSSAQNKELNLYEEKTTSPLVLKVEKDYMRHYINPPHIVNQASSTVRQMRPQKDILLFLSHHAPLSDWQSDILDIIRSESYYYSPQGLTKTLNEGWASYWHSKIMTNHILNDSEIFEFADKHSGVMSMPSNGYNPYKIGIELFRNIEDRWNKGQFGSDWDNCKDIKEKKNWNKKLNLGQEKIFEVRKILSDVAFIDQYLTEDFCIENKFYVYKLNDHTKKFEVDTTDFKAIKQMLLFKMTNFGQPIITVNDMNFQNRSELLMVHLHEGMDLQPDFLTETLKNVYKIWKRPVNLQTVSQEKETIYCYDGEKISFIK